VPGRKPPKGQGGPTGGYVELCPSRFIPAVALDSKSRGRKVVWVRFPPPALSDWTRPEAPRGVRTRQKRATLAQVRRSLVPPPDSRIPLQLRQLATGSDRKRPVPPTACAPYAAPKMLKGHAKQPGRGPKNPARQTSCWPPEPPCRSGEGTRCARFAAPCSFALRWLI